VTPTQTELALLRADPLLFEQELDVRPKVAESLEKTLGMRSGRRYWISQRGQLYGIELGDFGRGRPSMAIIYGFWPRFEPRPLSDEAIDEALAEFCLWMAEVCDGLERTDVEKTLARALPGRQLG
jgi:hypothetical protein